MERKSTTFWVGIAVCVVVFGLFVFVVVFIFKYFQPETLLALIVGLMPSIIYIWTQRSSKKREHANWILRDKRAHLLELVSMFSSLLTDKSSDEIKQRNIAKKLELVRPGFLIWGPPDMIELWNNLFDDRSDPTENIKKGERMLRIIRKELGHNDSKLPPGAIIATLIKAEEKQKVYEVCKGEVYKFYE